MATKTTLLLFFFAIIIVAEGAPLPVEWIAANKSISDMGKKMEKAFDEVNAAATPDKQKEALRATLKQALTVGINLEKAKDTRDEKKVVNIACLYERAADMVIAAPPAQKLKVMEEAFNAAAAPDLAQCPTIDKSFCDTFSKIENALHEVASVVSTAPGVKKVETLDAVGKQRHNTQASINKAYAAGDEKKIAGILAAYNKAADAVIAAAPAEKFKVMEEAFTAATAQLGA